MRGFFTARATGVTGSYQSLSDAGITFGSVGSTVGTANTLTLDQTKLRAALIDNPQAVFNLLAGFQSTATLQPGGTGSVASITGQPRSIHQDGTYTVTTTVTGSIGAVFTPTGGVAGRNTFGGTLTAGGTDQLAILGLNVTATTPLHDGANTIAVAVQQRGVLVGLGDFLDYVVGSGGLLATRMDGASGEIDRIAKGVTASQARVEEHRQRLQARFAQLETLMANLQQQQASLGIQLASFNKQ